jgi:PAS domain S-box-containing protein
MIPIQFQSEIRKSIQKAIQNKSIFEIEHPIIMGEKTAWMFTRAIPILNERQEIVEWFGTSGDITSRKAAEEYLRESEKRYSALFENKLNGILHARILTDAQNNPVDILYLDINEAYEKIIGLKSEQIKGKTVKEIFHGKIPISEKLDIYSRVALKNQEVRYEEYFEPAQRYLQIYAYCPKYGEFIAIFSDITERKIAEKALAESEKKFSIMFQTIPVGIILTTFEEGLIYDVNAGWLSLMGFSKKEEVLGKTTPELGLIPLAQQREFILKEFKQNGKVRNSEQTIRDRKGGLHQVIVNVDAIEIEDRKFVLSTLEDITDRKSMEDALRESQQKWVTTLSSIGDAVISTDTEGIVTFMNPEAERLTGWNHREILRKPIDQVLTILDNVTSLPVDYQLFSNIQVAGLSESKILLHRSGQKIPVDYNVAPIRTKEGRNQGIIVIFKDISKRKEAEEVVKNYSLHLENMVRERTAELETARKEPNRPIN